MNKKIIAVMIAATLIFVGVFAACNNNEENQPPKLYIEGDEYPFITDADGNKELDENGEFIVFHTDEDGDYAKDDKGNRLTNIQPFEPLSEKNVVEQYGYKITLPENWVIDESKLGAFKNKKTGDAFSIVIHDKSYQDVYESNFDTYEKLLDYDQVTLTWEENVEDLGDACEGVVRFTMKNEEGMNILYFFRNHGNIYKILYESKNPQTAIADSVALCNTISYKPFDYYPPVTDEDGSEVMDEFITQPVLTTAIPDATDASATQAPTEASATQATSN